MEFEEEVHEELDELVDLWQTLELRDGEIEEGSNIYDYFEADQVLATYEEPTIADFARTSGEYSDEESDEEMEE